MSIENFYYFMTVLVFIAFVVLIIQVRNNMKAALRRNKRINTGNIMFKPTDAFLCDIDLDIVADKKHFLTPEQVEVTREFGEYKKTI